MKKLKFHWQPTYPCGNMDWYAFVIKLRIFLKGIIIDNEIEYSSNLAGYLINHPATITNKDDIKDREEHIDDILTFAKSKKTINNALPANIILIDKTKEIEILF